MIVQILTAALAADPDIAAIFGENIFPQMLPDEPSYPALVVGKVSGQPYHDLQGNAGPERARVQIDVYFEDSYAACVDAARDVQGFIEARPPPGPPCVIDSARCINSFDLPANEPLVSTERAGPRLRRRVLEFQIIYANPA